MPASMRLDATEAELLLHVAGNLNASDFGKFDEILRSHEIGQRCLVIDLSQLGTIDSAGLGMLLVAREMCHAGRVVIRGASRELRQVLNIVNFGQLFEIE